MPGPASNYRVPSTDYMMTSLRAPRGSGGGGLKDSEKGEEVEASGGDEECAGSDLHENRPQISCYCVARIASRLRAGGYIDGSLYH